MPVINCINPVAIVDNNAVIRKPLSTIESATKLIGMANAIVFKTFNALMFIYYFKLSEKNESLC